LAGSAINAVESHRQFAVQMAHEITMRCRRVFEADHEMIIIREKRPCLQNERVAFGKRHSCIAQEIQFAMRIKERFSIQRGGRDHVSAVRR